MIFFQLLFYFMPRTFAGPMQPLIGAQGPALWLDIVHEHSRPTCSQVPLLRGTGPTNCLSAAGKFSQPSPSTILLGRCQTGIMHDGAACFGESWGGGEGVSQGTVEPAALWNPSLEREEAARSGPTRELRWQAPGTCSIVPLYFT